MSRASRAVPYGLADLYRRLGNADRAAAWRAAYDQILNGTFHAPSPR